MKISELMTPNPSFCTTEDTIIDCARIMAQRSVGIVPICESVDTRRVIGVVTDRDIVVRCIGEGRDLEGCRIEDIMSAHDLVTCREGDDSDEVSRKMKERHVRRVLVVDDYGSLAGVVSTRDLDSAAEKRKPGETFEALGAPLPPLK